VVGIGVASALGVEVGTDDEPGAVAPAEEELSGGTVADASVAEDPQAVSDNISNNAKTIEITLVILPLIVYGL
jgi:hypothetical protein